METKQARRQRSNIFKVIKEKNYQPRIYFEQKYLKWRLNKDIKKKKDNLSLADLYYKECYRAAQVA